MRHDAALIKHVAKLYSSALAKKLQATPFFYISEEVERNFADYKTLNEQGYKRQYPEYRANLMDVKEVERIMPFPMINVMDHDIGWHNIDWLGGTRWRVAICMDVMMRDLGIPIPPGMLIGFDLEYSWFDGVDKWEGTNYPQILVNSATGRINGLPLPLQKRMEHLMTTEDFKTQSMNHITRNLLYILSFFKWAQTQHLVEVRATNPKNYGQTKTAVKKPWLRDDLPHYVYLDEPKRVRECEPKKGDPTFVVRGHHRRGHLRKLTNPRFRNHPRYGQYVPVKPTWVGSRQWTVGETIYTLKGDLKHEISERPSDVDNDHNPWNS